MNEDYLVVGEHILVGLVGALILFCIEKSRIGISNKIIERKYPIAGKYLTTFEDEKDGLKLIITSPAILHQRGKKVFGETTFLDQSKEWEIQGQINDRGEFHGIYKSKNPFDKGSGNFFLFVNNDRQMTGLWSGYDSKNLKISSGKYGFEPIMSDIRIVGITENDIPAIASIADIELGKDYLTQELLGDYVTNNEKYIFKLAKNKKDIIGFCLSIILSEDEITNYVKLDNSRKTLHYAKTIGLIKTIAVSNKFKGKGVGTQLMSSTMENLKSKNVRSFCSVGWKNEDRINIQGIMTQFDFNAIMVIPNYWSEDSLKFNYDCVACGSPPCRCSAVIYSKHI